MKTLSPPERRALRAKAHHLDPVVIVGQHGLTPAVLHEIDVSLLAHELIKIRVLNDDRGLREQVLEQICEALDAAAVQHLGKLLVVWRPAPEPVKTPPARVRNKSSTTKQRAKAGTAAQISKQRTGGAGSKAPPRPRALAGSKPPDSRRTPRAASPGGARAPAAGARRRRQPT
jgi:putative YhbY family RNA-binding protein